MRVKAYRSKRSGLYFRFVQYCEDGYGKYEDYMPENYFEKGGSFPDFFALDHEAVIPFRDHKPDEVEEVIFEVNKVTI